MAIYTLSEFASYLQQDVDTDTATLLLNLVTGLVEEVDGNDYSTDTPTATVKAIALEAAARAYRNPEGVSSKTRNIDDYGATDRWDATAAGVCLTDEELERLTRPLGSSTGAFTIRQYYEPPTSSVEWWA